jgi:hypothetical protein
MGAMRKMILMAVAGFVWKKLRARMFNQTRRARF